MPVIKALPSPEIIRGLRGILDFYVWKGLNCVRKWPHIPPASRTPASMASAATFGAIVKGYSLLGGALKTLFARDAADQDRTGRDLYMSAVLGHLHEAGMSDFLDLLTEATAYLQALTDLRNALNDVGTDEIRALPAYDGAAWQALLTDAQRHLQADILSSALPTDAATAAHQVTQNTALALIEKLQAALESVNTDRLQVRGEDQLFSFDGPISNAISAAISGPNGYIESPAVSAGHYWVITTITGSDQTTAPTSIEIFKHYGATNVMIDAETKAFAIAEAKPWSGHVHLDVDDTIRIYFTGGLGGDTCAIHITGYQMTVET